ncbi:MULTISPECIES: glycosyl hydrolase 115 family protein [unclassified Streptomyces]|uniref:glycosyl hydrolase 115 family protein n=1 Tax=unclassified Streptomyces TaxID=2593676 RepID=UPI000CD5A236|nr:MULTISPECIES: glycosyl hydrolase 115 family protein [unclassified Streptomyces]AWL36949.1 glycosyl hydrolase [Streptomyces sp. SM18]
MDQHTPHHTSRRSLLGAGLGITALTATPLGSLTGLTGEAGATPHGPARPGTVHPTDPGAYLSFTPRPGAFALVENGRAVPVVVSDRDHPGVVRVAGDLRDDIERVTGVRPALAHAAPARAREIVLLGTIGRSPLIDRLIATGKLDVSGVEGAWETSLQTVVERPLPGVDRAFVVAGGDQRGAIFGAYDVSRGIGVSPWYWWDDVVPVHRDALYVLPGRYSQGTPAVKYRGFFVNDENPALGTWAPAYFGPGKAPGHEGGFNAGFYAKVFEVMLRLKANYLWPAVWGRAFAEDDPLNHATAKAYGVVMGTSHEAPMMRGIEEWNRHAVAAVRDAEGTVTTPGHDPYGGTGEWSFRRNAEAVKAYWREGVRRMADEDFEGVVTLGMRGNGDVSLPDGDGIDLMREIIASQRAILAEELGSETAVPQVWTLYKEVQHYWDRGLRVPDDVTVVLTDDNWANVRMLPDLGTDDRTGGYGLYYHFDYVGVGRNYKWVDTTSLPNMWDQLHQSAAYGNHGLWVSNVGDLKGNELPTQFFLDYAWNPERWPLESLPEWEEGYARQNFGEKRAEEIAAVLRTYAALQSRRKPELLNRRITLDPAKDPATDSSAIVYDDEATPFSLVDYRELERVTEDWRRLDKAAERVRRELPASAQDAWYQLVGYAVRATANLYALREAEFTNLHYAPQGRALTNTLAATAEDRLADDFALARRFDHEIAGGKWEGFQSQPHIGYGDVARYGPNAPWQQPELNDVAIEDEIFPAVRRITLPRRAEMGVAVDGSEFWWPGAAGSGGEPELPVFSPYQSQPAQYVEVFNRGTVPFDVRIRTGAPWLLADRTRARVDTQTRVTFRVDWSRAPKGVTRVPVTVTGPGGREVVVRAVVDRPRTGRGRLAGFVEANGYVSMEADHFHRAVGQGGITWRRVPGIGRTGAGMEPFPVTASRRTPGGAGPRLEYRLSLFTTGPVTVWAYLSPRNNTLATDGLTYAVSFDDDAPRSVNITAVTGSDDGTMNPQWARTTSDNVNRTATVHRVGRAGAHVLKFWMVDPTVVLQNLVVDTGGLKPSYLGPPESLRLS